METEMRQYATCRRQYWFRVGRGCVRVLDFLREPKKLRPTVIHFGLRLPRLAAGITIFSDAERC
jgi:hypothetical protein